MAANRTTRPGGILSNLLGLLGMSMIAGLLVGALATPAIAVASIGAKTGIQLFETLPDYLDIQPLQQKTEVFATKGGQPVKIAEFYAQNREPVPADQIPDFVKQVAIDTEDPEFYHHSGVDFQQVLKAAAGTVLHLGRGGGASTITMQYVRNVLIQNAENIADPEARQSAYEEATQQTPERKIKEMRLAIGVEKQYSKEEILNGYLNIALFGGNIYGIQSAAKYYFGVNAKDLSLPQAASLVAMVQEPNGYRLDNPENIEANQERRDYLLHNMNKRGHLSEADMQAALATPVTPAITPSPRGCQTAGDAAYFCQSVQHILETDPAFGDTDAERKLNMETKGYQVQTTLNLDLLAQSRQLMLQNVGEQGQVAGTDLGSAVNVMENNTGRVLVQSQNTTYDPASSDAQNVTAVNYSTDRDWGGSSGFNVGSTFKPIDLATWLEQGHSLTESINGGIKNWNQNQFKTGSCAPEFGSAPFSVVNDDGGVWGRALTPLVATQYSLNTGYMYMASKLKLCDIVDVATRLGIHRADGQPLQVIPLMVLGYNETSPIVMTNAFNALLNSGKRCDPKYIDAVTFADGTQGPVPKTNCNNEAVKPNAANNVARALQAVLQTGDGSTYANPRNGHQYGAKTGTSDENVQTWSIGGNPNFTVGVWVGTVDGSKARVTDQLDMTGPNSPGAGVYTIYTARHRIMHDLLISMSNLLGTPNFNVGTNTATVPSGDVAVPSVAGQSITQATDTLTAAGFDVVVGKEVDSDQPKGTVASTDPAAGSKAPGGATITLNVSNGSKQAADQAAAGTPAPNLVGMTQQQALDALSKAGFKGNLSITRTSQAGATPGQIVSQTPAAGTRVDPSSDIAVVIAS